MRLKRPRVIARLVIAILICPSCSFAADNFWACLSSEAIEAEHNAGGANMPRTGDDALTERVLENCSARYPKGRADYDFLGVEQMRYEVRRHISDERWKLQVAEQDARRKKIDAEAEKYLPRYKNEIKTAFQDYVKCLARNAADLARRSGESAETIIKAAIASCRAKRQAVLGVQEGYRRRFPSGTRPSPTADGMLDFAEHDETVAQQLSLTDNHQAAGCPKRRRRNSGHERASGRHRHHHQRRAE